MKPIYATTLHFQREQRGAWHRYLSERTKREWRKRHFKQFLDEQVKQSEMRNDAKQELDTHR